MVPPALAVAGADLLMPTSATAFTGVLVDEVLSLGLGSVTPAGGVTVAVLVIEPVVAAPTVPAIVIVMLEPAGRVGTVPDTTLEPLTPTEAGHTAPPEAELQLAVTPLMELGTASLNVAAFALLGPALLITIL